tara:strand:+ start:69 stop:527 length:459 start_codon:yes stop_codon:yes gene_type:complete
MESRIEKLDYVLDLVLKSNGFIIANDLYNSKFYDNNGIMESEFLEMVLEFKRLRVAEVVNQGKGLKKNERTQNFVDDGGFANYYAKEKETSKKENERQELKDEIDRLTKVNLELQNKQMKRYVVYSIIAFVLGAIITNVKDILILLNITNQE